MRSIDTVYWAALAVAVAANVFSNVAFKQAMTIKHPRAGSGTAFWVLAEPWTWIGLASAGILLSAYLFAIREVPLSIAYPVVTGFAMVGIAIFSGLLFDEVVTPSKIVGIGSIAIGIALLAQ